MNHWMSDLPAELARTGFRWGDEAAWPREAALEVVRALSGRGLAVLGVEVWIPTKEGPRIPAPFIYTWSYDAVQTPADWADTVSSANDAATKWISSFRWDPQDRTSALHPPYFNLEVFGEADATGGPQ